MARHGAPRRRGKGFFDKLKNLAGKAWEHKDKIIAAGKAGKDLYDEVQKKGGRAPRRRRCGGGLLGDLKALHVKGRAVVDTAKKASRDPAVLGWVAGKALARGARLAGGKGKGKRR